MADDTYIHHFAGDIAAMAAHQTNTLLGNVLAVGAKLVAEGQIPEEVVESRAGVFALCLVERDASEVRMFRSGESVEVGRAPEGGGLLWTVGDPWMSRRHFVFAVDGDGTPSLKSLGAKNGLFVNDRACSGEMPLKRGDVIRAGNTQFLLF